MRLFAVIFTSFLLLAACGYRFEGDEPSFAGSTISVPYVQGDLDGGLSTALVEALSTSGHFSCVQNGGMYTLDVSIVSDGDDRIGYRYDRNPTTGKLRDNIVGTENRRTIAVSVSLKETYTQEVIVGPQVVEGFAEYDYVDSNSIHDLVFFNPVGTPQEVLDFSVGQLDSIEGAHDDVSPVIYRNLARKIVDGILMTEGIAISSTGSSPSEK